MLSVLMILLAAHVRHQSTEDAAQNGDDLRRTRSRCARPRGPGAPISATSLPAHLSFVNGAERSRALHVQSSGTSHMDQNLENLIRERAYEIWTSHGCVHGQADQHWLAAEREILTASTATLPGKPGPQKKRPLPARSKITKTLARAG